MALFNALGRSAVVVYDNYEMCSQLPLHHSGIQQAFTNYRHFDIWKRLVCYKMMFVAVSGIFLMHHRRCRQMMNCDKL